MTQKEARARRAEVELFRCGCRHCDAAEEELGRLARKYGARLVIGRVEMDPYLKKLAGWSTPVVCVNGRQVTRYRISIRKWEAAIRREAAAGIGG